MFTSCIPLMRAVRPVSWHHIGDFSWKLVHRPWFNDIAQPRKVKFWEINFSLCADMRLKLSEIVVVTPCTTPAISRNIRWSIATKWMFYYLITLLPPIYRWGLFLIMKIQKNQFLKHVNSFCNINWWVDRTRLELLASVFRALYHMFLRKKKKFKSKILALLKTPTKASQHHQKSEKMISRTCEKSLQ